MCGSEFLNDDRGFLSPWAELARAVGSSSDGRSLGAHGNK